MKTIKLTYQARLLNSERKPAKLNYFGDQQDHLRHEVFLSSRTLHIKTYAAKGKKPIYERHHDLETSRSVEINEITKSYAERIMDFKQRAQYEDDYEICSLGKSSSRSVQDRSFTAHDFILTTDTVRIHLALASSGFTLHKKSLELLQHTLFMGIPIPLDDHTGGLPLEISFSSRKDDSDDLYLIRLTGYQEVKKAPKAPSPKKHKDRLRSGKVNVEKILRQNRDRRKPGKEQHRFQQQVQAYTNSFRTGTYTLSASGGDFYWCFRQSLLDTFRQTLNPLLDGHSFYGDGEGGDQPMHVEMDLFNSLTGKLDYNDDFYLRLKRLLAYLVVIEGGELPAEDEQDGGLSAAEAADYADIIADTQDANQYNQPIDRITRYKDEFNTQRRDQIAEAYFATLGITGTKQIDFGEDEITENGEFVKLKVWDFDTTLDLNGNLIDTFDLRDDGTIRLTLFIDRIHVDYQWSTLPNGSLSSWICNILTLGACSWALQSNYGYGFFKLDDTKLAFDMVPRMEGGELTFDLEIDEEDTDIDITTINIGVNPIADILSLAASAIGSWFDGIGKGYIIDGITDGLEDFKLDQLLPWASNLHNIDGPAVTADIGTFENDGVALAANVTADGPFPPSPNGRPDLSRIDQQGFLYSRRYLTAWLYEIIGPVAENASLPIDISEAFGVDLPDPSSFASEDDGEDDTSDLERLGDEITGRLDDLIVGGPWGTVAESCRNKPPVRNVSFANEVSITRSAPTVIFPQNGVVDIAGKVEMEYQFSIRAEKHSQVPRPIVTPVRCYRLKRDLPEPGPFGFSREQFEQLYRPMREGFGGPMGGPGRTNPVGYTPDPQNPDGGGWPQGPDLPEQRGLPEIVCEPPRCEWGYTDSRHNLHTYLQASVRLTADLMLGFDLFSDPWLPGVRLLVADDSMQTEVSLQTIDEPFDDLDLNDLKEMIRETCIEDAEQVLRRALQQRILFFLCPQVNKERDLVPALANLFLDDAINDEIRELIRFVQSGSADALSYEVVNGQYLYWKFELEEDLSNHLA